MVTRFLVFLLIGGERVQLGFLQRTAQRSSAQR
jgi:hypothetical protein